MRKGMWSAAAFVVLSSGAALLWVPTVQAADGNRVGMKDQLSYDPPDISVPVNTPLVFHNDGNIPHDAKAEDNSFATPLLDPGKEHSVTFKTPGVTIKYFCTVEGHKAAGMIGTVRVTEAGSTPPPAPTTPTTAAGGTTTTTAAGAATTTTTAKAAAGTGGSTTTTAAAASGATTTTLAPSGTPTSGSETAGETTTTTAAAHNGGGEEAAADDHASEGAGKKDKKKSSPIGIAFAAVSTLLLTAIAGKLLASKS